MLHGPESYRAYHRLYAYTAIPQGCKDVPQLIIGQRMMLSSFPMLALDDGNCREVKVLRVWGAKQDPLKRIASCSYFSASFKVVPQTQGGTLSP